MRRRRSRPAERADGGRGVAPGGGQARLGQRAVGFRRAHRAASSRGPAQPDLGAGMRWLPSAADHRRRCRSRLSGRDGLSPAAVVDLRPGVGLAARLDDIPARRRGPGRPRSGDRSASVLQLRAAGRCGKQLCSAASTLTRRESKTPTPRFHGGWSTLRPAPVSSAVDALVPQWIAAAWPFTQPRYVGRDLSWADWLALPDIDPPPASTPVT
jgi:hypothetical protein